MPSDFASLWATHDAALEKRIAAETTVIVQKARERLAKSRGRLLGEIHKRQYDKTAVRLAENDMLKVRLILRRSLFWPALSTDLKRIAQVMHRSIRRQSRKLYKETANRYVACLTEAHNFDAHFAVNLAEGDIASVSRILIDGQPVRSLLLRVLRTWERNLQSRLLAETMRIHSLTEWREGMVKGWAAAREKLLRELREVTDETIGRATLKAVDDMNALVTGTEWNKAKVVK